MQKRYRIVFRNGMQFINTIILAPDLIEILDIVTKINPLKSFPTDVNLEPSSAKRKMFKRHSLQSQTSRIFLDSMLLHLAWDCVSQTWQKCELLDLTLLLQTPHFSTDIYKSFGTSNEAFVYRAINVINKKKNKKSTQ